MAFSQDQEMSEWKYEPLSPSGTLPLGGLEEDWILFDDRLIGFPNDAAETIYNLSDPSLLPTSTSEEMENSECEKEIKEEPFEGWMEDTKQIIPLFADFAAENEGNEIGYQPDVLKPQQHQQTNTQKLLEEFESVLGDIGAGHEILPNANSTLTPPLSPQQPQQNVDTRLLITLQPVQQQLFPAGNETILNGIAGSQDANPIYVDVSPRQWGPTITERLTLDDELGNSLESDVANELAVVEEYVRSHIKDIPSPSSPCTSSGSSCISTEDSVDDPEWTLENEKIRKPAKLSASRYKPYQGSRPSVEDKKVRKKEQNKNAATRYRQKKKQEIKEVQAEERELAETNANLKHQVTEIQREIKYFKSWMRQLLETKGVLPK